MYIIRFKNIQEISDFISNQGQQLTPFSQDRIYGFLVMGKTLHNTT